MNEPTSFDDVDSGRVSVASTTDPANDYTGIEDMEREYYTDNSELIDKVNTFLNTKLTKEQEDKFISFFDETQLPLVRKALKKIKIDVNDSHFVHENYKTDIRTVDGHYMSSPGLAFWRLQKGIEKCNIHKKTLQKIMVFLLDIISSKDILYNETEKMNEKYLEALTKNNIQVPTSRKRLRKKTRKLNSKRKRKTKRKIKRKNKKSRNIKHRS